MEKKKVSKKVSKKVAVVGAVKPEPSRKEQLKAYEAVAKRLEEENQAARLKAKRAKYYREQKAKKAAELQKEKLLTAKGLKKFVIMDFTVWAINEKNAHRKAAKMVDQMNPYKRKS